jgi:hypothetical protein
MPYQTSALRATRTADITLAASAARTATGTGSAVEMGDSGILRLTLDITAASGTTPTLDVAIQTSQDGSTGWTTVASFAQQTGVATVRKVFAGFDRYARASWTIAGTTPSFTFSCVGDGV